MSDEIRPDNVVTMDEAKLARSWGIKPGAVRVVELSGDDPFWKETDLAVAVGFARSLSTMGLEMPGDWPCLLKPGEPMHEMAEAGDHLRQALASLREVAAKHEEDGREGAQQAARLAATWAVQLDALMRSMHVAGNCAYRRAKAEREIHAIERSRRGGGP